MGSTSNLQAGSSAAQGVSAWAGAETQAMALRSQGEWQKASFEANARMAEFNAAEAIKRGDKAADSLKKQAKGMIGAQRAAFAAQGIEIDSGSAAEIQEETAGMAEVDALTIKNNAWREAWGFKVQANDLANQGAMAGMAANNAARNTLLTGGLQALGYGLQSGAYYKEGRSPAKSPQPTGKVTAGGAYRKVSNIS